MMYSIFRFRASTTRTSELCTSLTEKNLSGLLGAVLLLLQI